MSLESIISQLQSVQPGNKKVTADTIAADLTRIRNSVIRLSKLLQNSGRTAGSKYLPNVSNTSKTSQRLERSLNQISKETSKLSLEHNRLKAYTRQSVESLTRQIRSLKGITDRNQNAIKSLQSEIAMNRPMKMISDSFNRTNRKIDSFDRSVRNELRKISERVGKLEREQQKINRMAETQAPGGAPGKVQDIISPGARLPFQQRLILSERIQRVAMEQSTGAFAGLGGGVYQRGSREAEGAKNELIRALIFGFGAGSIAGGLTSGGNSFMNWLSSIFSNEKKLGPAGSPFMDASLNFGIKQGASPSEVKAIIEEEKKVIEKLGKTTDPQEKTKLQEQIASLKKQRLEALQKAGIITSEHVAENLAKAEDVTYYKRETADGVEYIDKSVVAQYPELWTKEPTNEGVVVLAPDWKKKISDDMALQKKIRESSKEYFDPQMSVYGSKDVGNVFGEYKSYKDIPFEKLKPYIIEAETGQADDPYNIVYGEPEKNYVEDIKTPPTEMTMDQLMAFQTKLIQETRGLIPGTSLGTSAVGAYQFTRDTLFGSGGKPGLVNSEPFPLGKDWKKVKFTKENQDKLAALLFGQRKGSEEQLSGTWAFFRNIGSAGEMLRTQTPEDVVSAPELISQETTEQVKPTTEETKPQTVTSAEISTQPAVKPDSETLDAKLMVATVNQALIDKAEEEKLAETADKEAERDLKVSEIYGRTIGLEAALVKLSNQINNGLTTVAKKTNRAVSLAESTINNNGFQVRDPNFIGGESSDIFDTKLLG